MGLINLSKSQKVPVSEKALIQRINRKLKSDHEVVKKTRHGRAWRDLGDFYRLDWYRNTIIDHHIDLEDLGRELEVLEAYEVLQPAE
jgi:hypothetical protein